MNTLRTRVLLVALVTVLSGCAAEPAPSPAASVAAVVDDLDGDGVLSSDEENKLPVREYAMPDGTVVPIYRDQPAPEAVVDAATVIIAPAAAYISAGTAFTLAEREADYLAALKDQSAKTGKTIIGIIYGFGFEGSRAWAVSTPIADFFHTKEEAIAAAEAYMGESTDK